MKPCVFPLDSLFGPLPCGHEGTVYDRARRGYLCREHSKERLCEFCQADRAWGRRCYLKDGIAYEAWLCLSCAGWTVRSKERK